MTGSFFKMLANSYDQDNYEKNRLSQEDYNEMVEKKIEHEKKEAQRDEAIYQEEKKRNEEENRKEEEQEDSVLVDAEDFIDNSEL